MNWFEKSTKRMIQHRLASTYQMSLLLELFLALLSFVLIAEFLSSLSVSFGISRCGCSGKNYLPVRSYEPACGNQNCLRHHAAASGTDLHRFIFLCKYLYIYSGFCFYRAAVPYFYTCLLSKNGMD